MAGRDDEFSRKMREKAALAGGTLLGDGAKRQIIARTSHTTTFQNCQMDLQAVVGDDNKIEGYLLRILDSMENHIYVYSFDQTAKDQMHGAFSSLPNVGDDAPTEETVLND